MSLHWIYSQGRIAQAVKANGGVAAFLEPDEANYTGVPAFFAHPHRKTGDGSNYSEYFGVGGEYVGYADGPMRETIFNIAALGKRIERTVLEADSPLSNERRVAAAHYIAGYFFEFDTAELKETIRTPLRLQE